MCKNIKTLCSHRREIRCWRYAKHSLWPTLWVADAGQPGSHLACSITFDRRENPLWLGSTERAGSELFHYRYAHRIRYETIANKPIIAGKTKGQDVATILPTHLGHLARGSSATPLGTNSTPQRRLISSGRRFSGRPGRSRSAFAIANNRMVPEVQAVIVTSRKQNVFSTARYAPAEFFPS